MFFVFCFLFGVVLGELVLRGFYVFVGVCLGGVFVKWRFKAFFCVLLGVLRFLVSFDEVVYDFGVGEFEGCIVSEADVRDVGVRYVFEIDEVRVLLKGRRYPVFKRGECLKVSGELLPVYEVEGFDYARYLSLQDVYGILDLRGAEKISEKFSLWNYIYSLKIWFEGRLNRIFGEPHGALMSGLILGSKRGIDKDLLEDFNRTGLTHIVAISGYNITLVILFANFVFSFLPIERRVWLALVFIFLFVMLVGAQASVVRAGIMGSLSLYALFLGRKYLALRALVLSAFFMVLWNPKILIYDVGFQLSVLSTLGLILCGDKLQKWLGETLAMTFAAQLFTLPIVVFNFERFSLVSFLANIFVLPFVPLAMMFGFLAAIFGRFFGFFGFVCLEIIVFFVEFFSQVSWAVIDF